MSESVAQFKDSVADAMAEIALETLASIQNRYNNLKNASGILAELRQKLLASLGKTDTEAQKEEQEESLETLLEAALAE